MIQEVRLRTYDNSWYSPGRSIVWRVAWMFLGQPLFSCLFLPFSPFRVALLRLFGANVGTGVVIRSGVQVKYPWHLVIGSDCWIGEQAWIDNLTTVRIGDDVCVSQGAYICTGNHNWNDAAFGLLVRGVELQRAAWAGAKCILLPGATLCEGAVAGAGSVVRGTVPAWQIYAGNPATYLSTRQIGSKADSLREVLS